MLLAILAITVGVSFLILTNRHPTNPDSIGYIFAGLQLADGEGLSHDNSLNREVAPFFYLHSFRAIEAGSPQAWFGYPAGYPILIAFAKIVSGRLAAAFYVTSLLPPLALVITFLLARYSGQSRWIALAASAILAASVSLWRFGTEPWSELPTLVAISLGALAFMLSRDPERAHLEKGWSAVVAGVLFGYALLIRPTNLILLGPTLLLTDLALAYPGFSLASLRRTGWSTYAVIGIFAAISLAYNWLALGGPLNNIYSTPELGAYPWPLFSLSYALGDSPIGKSSFLRSLTTLWENFAILLPLAPIGWRRLGRSSGFFSASLTLSTVALYSVYAFPPVGVNARFLIPAFPFIAVGIGAGFQGVWEHLSKPLAKGLAATLLLVLLVLLWRSIPKELDERNTTASETVAAVRNMVTSSPLESVWISASQNDIITFYGNRATLNYRRALQGGHGGEGFDVRSMEGCVVNAVSTLLKRGTPVYFLSESDWGIDRILDSYFTLEPDDGGYLRVLSASGSPSLAPECGFRHLR